MFSTSKCLTVVSCTFRLTMENIIKNSNLINTTTQLLKQELTVLRKAYNLSVIEDLKGQNETLNFLIERYIKRLNQLEAHRGIKQIAVPQQNAQKNAEVIDTPKLEEKKDVDIKSTEKPVTDKKEKKKAENEKKKVEGEKKKAEGEKKEKKQTEKKKPDTDNLPVDVGRLDLRVGKILKAEKHPDADSLYVSQIECGDAAPRTVVSGLVKFVPIEELQGRMVLVLCNLKPVKMRGILSEAMVMCASTPEAVEVLSPPEDSNPGDLVECPGFTRQPDPQMNPKKKIFETVAPDLKTNDALQACYMGKPLLVAGKNIEAKSLKNVQIK